MSYKPDEMEWMAYLYGELEEEDKRKFDQYILQHPEARLELEKYQNLLGLLSSVEDKEVIAPIVVGENQSRQAKIVRPFFWNEPYVRVIAAVAASLILIILVGKFTGTQLRVSDKELRLSFGEPAQEPVVKMETTPQGLTEDEIRTMIASSLEENNIAIQTSLEETQKKLDASIRGNLARSSGHIDRLVKEASTASQEQIRQFVDGIRTENMQHVKDYFQLTSTEQKQYIENLLVDFSKYLQQQRNDDLQLVQMRMNSLEQNTDLFKQETEQILSSIITRVGTPVSGETRN